MNCKSKIDADIVIYNGIIYTGIEKAPDNTIIAVKNDTIIYIGDEEKVKVVALKRIDATGQIVCPGFIDPHTHADRDLIDLEKSNNEPFLFQGVTTVVVGNDGDSYYPTSKYKKLYSEQGIGTNAVLLTGHGTIRNQVIGKSNRPATPEEIKKMKEITQLEMDAGAFGISTGLFYAPGSYADTQEVIALTEVVAKNDGIYDTHIRDESSYTVGLIKAIEEAIEIGEKAAIPIHISHIKCLGVDVWKKSDTIIKLINVARKKGIEITANQYPYEASATGLIAATVPRWVESGGKDSIFVRYHNRKLTQKILDETKENITRRGGGEKLLIVNAENKDLIGKTLLEISKQMQLSSEKTVFEIIKNNNIRVASFNMNNYDIINFMQQEWVVTGSDGNTGHPRKYGSFPRKYQMYVKQQNIIDLERFIKNSTSKTAEIFKIPKRGIIKEGYVADIIIFDPENFRDQANYIHPFQLSEGLVYSIINGKIAVENGNFTGGKFGKVLSKK